MNQHTADNRADSGERIRTEPLPTETDVTAADSAQTPLSDPLDEIEVELDRLSGVDPAESVAVLADITAVLNREIDADQEAS